MSHFNIHFAPPCTYAYIYVPYNIRVCVYICPLGFGVCVFVCASVYLLQIPTLMNAISIILTTRRPLSGSETWIYRVFSLPMFVAAGRSLLPVVWKGGHSLTQTHKHTKHHTVRHVRRRSLCVCVSRGEHVAVIIIRRISSLTLKMVVDAFWVQLHATKRIKFFGDRGVWMRTYSLWTGRKLSPKKSHIPVLCAFLA